MLILKCSLQVWRDLYSFACFIAACVHLQQLDPNWHKASAPNAREGHPVPETTPPQEPESCSPEEAIGAALHELDMAAIMGGPLFRPEVDQLISAVQSLHQQHLAAAPGQGMPPAKRQRRSDESACPDRSQSSANQQTADQAAPKVSVSKFVHDAEHPDSGAGPQVQQTADASVSHLLPPGSLAADCHMVPTEPRPSLER